MGRFSHRDGSPCTKFSGHVVTVQVTRPRRERLPDFKSYHRISLSSVQLPPLLSRTRDREVGMQAEKLNVLMHGTQMRIVFAIIALSLSLQRGCQLTGLREERRRGEGSAKRLAIKGINNGSVFGFAPHSSLSLSFRVSGAQKAALSLDNAPLCGGSVSVCLKQQTSSCQPRFLNLSCIWSILADTLLRKAQ